MSRFVNLSIHFKEFLPFPLSEHSIGPQQLIEHNPCFFQLRDHIIGLIQVHIELVDLILPVPAQLLKVIPLLLGLLQLLLEGLNNLLLVGILLVHCGVAVPQMHVDPVNLLNHEVSFNHNFLCN